MIEASQTDTPDRINWKFQSAFLLASFLLIALLQGLPSGNGRAVVLVFPEKIDKTAALGQVLRSGGQLLNNNRQSNVIVARFADDRNIFDYWAMGAWVAFDQQAALSCGRLLL